jgi:glycosyltransferase involved in cell wall biosynthesis
MIITIFTPTYNRADELIALHKSLLSQTVKGFEWVIVDDGSVDHTKELLDSFKASTNFSITYIYQKNGGKHRAINQGVKIAQGDLFFIVDSDDFLPQHAVETLIDIYENHKHLPAFGGVAGRKSYFDGKLVGSSDSFENIFSNALDIRYKHHIQGDLAEVFLTKVLKEFPFPEIDNEKFCPEALVWNRIAQQYKLFYFNKNVYHCEYLSDGLTAKIVKIRMTSPMASMLTYSELESYNVPLKEKIKANINFWRFSLNSHQSIFTNLKMVNLLFSIIGMPLGLIMFINDKRNFS